MCTVDYISLGQNIRKYRRLMNLTQEQLAEKAFLSSGYIGDIERADRILSVQALLDICHALNVSPNLLLFESLPQDVLNEILDRPLTLRQPDTTLRNTLTNWYFADLPDESIIGEPPVTPEQLSRLEFTLLGDDITFLYERLLS